MKTLSLLFVAIAISIGASAQANQDTSHHKMHKEYSQKNHDMYSFKNGKTMMNKNGTQSAVTQDATLDNGTTVSPEGKVTWKNGKTETLKEGDWVDMNGKVHSKTMKSDKWATKPDNSKNK
ncbi:MAG: DUF6799 domain-containing protein [Ginsengibacter sp.]